MSRAAAATKHVVVVGAGLGGLSAVLSLRGMGFGVTVLERGVASSWLESHYGAMEGARSARTARASAARVSIVSLSHDVDPRRRDTKVDDVVGVGRLRVDLHQDKAALLDQSRAWVAARARPS